MPGPRIPLYAAGAEVESIYPVIPKRAKPRQERRRGGPSSQRGSSKPAYS